MRQVCLLVVAWLLLSSWVKAEGVIGAKGVTWTFFSDGTSGVFCRLRADEITPAIRRHGPFIMPAAGFDVRNPRMELRSLKCGERDWRSLLQTLAAWGRMSSPGGFYVTLPDKSVLALRAMPQVRAGRLIAPLGKGKRRTGLLFIEHDGADGLRVRILGAAAESPSGANFVQ